jgi:adenosine deaminase
VEESSFAGIPSTKICMNCHTQIWAESPILAPRLKVSRIDHGVRCIEDPNLTARLAADGIPLTVCSLSKSSSEYSSP